MVATQQEVFNWSQSKNPLIGAKVYTLLDNLSDINQQDIKGNTILHYLVQNEGYTLFFELLKRGADITIENNMGVSVYNVLGDINKLSWYFNQKINQASCHLFNDDFFSYHPNTQKKLFQSYRRSNKWHSIEEALNFVKKINLQDDKSVIDTVFAIKAVTDQKKLNWYFQSTYNNPVNNASLVNMAMCHDFTISPDKDVQLWQIFEQMPLILPQEKHEDMWKFMKAMKNNLKTPEDIFTLSYRKMYLHLKEQNFTFTQLDKIINIDKKFQHWYLSLSLDNTKHHKMRVKI